MLAYERDDYEDLDEYEDDEEQEEENVSEDGYVESQQPTKEQLEYLELRQKLKESIRKKLKKDMGTANAGSQNITGRRRRPDNYGSFFGPSQTVIAQRVIEESKSYLENPELLARINKPKNNNNKNFASGSVKSKPQVNHLPAVANGLKQKGEILKKTRDYSFLLSGDAEVPAIAKNPPPKCVSDPKTDARSAQLMPRGKHVANDGRREVSNGRDERKPMPAGGHGKPEVMLDRTAKLSIESRKQFGSNNASGPGRPAGLKSGMPSKDTVPSSGKVTSNVKNVVAGVPKPKPSIPQSGPIKPMASRLESTDRKFISSSGQASLKKPLVQRKEYHETSKPNGNVKRVLPPSKDPLKRPPPKPPARDSFVDGRPKTKPKRPLRNDSDGEDAEAISMIRQMFRYNPNKFRDEDNDSDMEANFEDIMREERLSAKIARKEDEEQLRLIEEEEKQRRMRVAKKRKLSANG